MPFLNMKHPNCNFYIDNDNVINGIIKLQFIKRMVRDEKKTKFSNFDFFSNVIILRLHAKRC